MKGKKSTWNKARAHPEQQHTEAQRTAGNEPERGQDQEYSARLNATLSREWNLNPQIERRLSGRQREDTQEGVQIPKGASDYSPLSSQGSVSPKKAFFSSSKGSRTARSSSDRSGISENSNPRRYSDYVMYSNQKKAQALSYTNIPGLHGQVTGEGNADPPLNQSYSSLDLPGGHVGSQPHSRKSTPKENQWMDQVSMKRLVRFFKNIPTKRLGMGGGTQQGILVADRSLSDISSDDELDLDVDMQRNSLREQIQGEIISMRDSTEKVNQKKSWWKNLIGEMEGQSDPYKSDYLALVPLSDPRLNKRWPLWVFVLIATFMSLLVFLGVFIFVQRSVDVNQGGIITKTSKIKVNQTAGIHGSYTLDLEIDLPVSNHNFFPATVSGGLGVFLFNDKGGEVKIQDEPVDAKSTRVFKLIVNASYFDDKLTTTIISRCTILRPNQLQFVLQGSFTTSVLFYPKQVTVINTYAIVDCKISPQWSTSRPILEKSQPLMIQPIKSVI